MEALSGEIVSLQVRTTGIGIRPSCSRKFVRYSGGKVCFWTRRQSECRSSRAGSGYTEDALDKFIQEMAAVGEEEILKDGKPPRLCTLRAFREEGVGDLDGKVWDDASTSVLFKPLAANVQATAQARNFETLSGRFAMVAFAVALGVEVVTGNGVFEGIELKQVGEVATACIASVALMAGFLAARGAKNRIGVDMTKGCQDLVEFALTDILDAMFYEDDLL